MANSLRSFSREDIPAVLELSRRAFGRAEEQVGNPLWASLDELESDKADCVRGAYLDGFSYEELATRHSVPLNTMRTWLRRSLLKLRECLSA